MPALDTLLDRLHRPGVVRLDLPDLAEDADQIIEYLDVEGVPLVVREEGAVEGRTEAEGGGG